MSKPYDNGSDYTYPSDNYKPHNKKVKHDTLKNRIDNPTEKALSKVFGGLHNEKSNKRLMKKNKNYRIKHF